MFYKYFSQIFVHKYFPLQKTAQPPAQASVPEEVGPVTSATGTSVTVTQDTADTSGKPKFIKVKIFKYFESKIFLFD